MKHISWDCKCQFNRTTCNSNKKWNNDTCQCKCKKYRTCKKGCNPSTCICENSRYLISIAETLVSVCDKIVNATNTIPVNMTNTISTNVTSTNSTNSDRKKVRYKQSKRVFAH